MTKSHILIVDDDSRILSLLSEYLTSNGYLVTLTKDTKAARQALELFNFDLIVLDVMLPNELGTEFAYNLRHISKVAILMLTAMGEPNDRIKGLESGADDYLTKPFEPKELLLRIKKLLARTRSISSEASSIIDLGKTKYDSKRNILMDHGNSILMSSGENKLLRALLANQNKAVSREELAKILKINPRSVDVQVTRLRNKIEYDPRKPLLLQAVRGMGYVLYAN